MDSEYSSHENVWWFEVPHSRAKWQALVLKVVNTLRAGGADLRF